MSTPVGYDTEVFDGPGILASMWLYKGAIALITIVATALTYFVSTLLPTVYSATATVVLSDANALNQDPGDPERIVEQEAVRIASRSVLERASEMLGPAVSVGEVRRAVSIEADPLTGVVEVTAEGPTPEMVAETANTVVAAYEQTNRESTAAQIRDAQNVLQRQARRLRERINELEGRTGNAELNATDQQQLEILQSRLAELESRVGQLAADAALFGSGIRQVEQATVPSGPSAPQPLVNALVVGFVAFGIASALAYWRAGYLASLKLDPERILGAPLLAEIPEFRRLERSDANALFDMHVAEAYQFLLSSFEFALAGTNARSVLITSAFAGDGKSLTALHLARALAIQGRDVTLVDADIRARGLTKILRAEDDDGLVALAEGKGVQDVVRQFRVSEQIRLSVVPAGQPQGKPTGLLATDRYRDAIDRVIEASELTLIDSGPLLTVADASAIAAQVSSVIIILSPDMTRTDLAKVHERVRLIPTPLMGLVVNRVPDADFEPYPGAPGGRPSRLLSRMRRRRSPG